MNHQLHERTDRLTAWVTDLFGSARFLLCCFLLIVFYFAWNLGWLGLKPIEHYPFGGLELILSIFAIFLTVTILIAQNRQRQIEKIREEIEFEVNVKAEKEITKMLHMLDALHKKFGIDQPDPELEQMKEKTDLLNLHAQASKAIKND